MQLPVAVGPHNKVICSFFALLPPLDAGHSLSRSSTVMPQLPLQGNQEQPTAEVVGCEGSTEQRGEGMIPHKERPLCWKKMSRLAFTLRGEIEMAL